MAQSAPVVRAKVAMIGAPGVGKTSLVRRFVHSLFSDEYRSTLGVKVDRKIVVVERATVTMLLWDMHGETDGLVVPDHYLGGTAAALAVFDATRPETLATATLLRDRLAAVSPNAVTLSVANKQDLAPDWDQIDADTAAAGFSSYARTSAKSGDGVEEVFHAVALAIRDAREKKRAALDG